MRKPLSRAQFFRKRSDLFFLESGKRELYFPEGTLSVSDCRCYTIAIPRKAAAALPESLGVDEQPFRRHWPGWKGRKNADFCNFGWICSLAVFKVSGSGAAHDLGTGKADGCGADDRCPALSRYLRLPGPGSLPAAPCGSAAFGLGPAADLRNCCKICSRYMLFIAQKSENNFSYFDDGYTKNFGV